MTAVAIEQVSTRRHLLSLYSDEDELIASVSDYLAESLDVGGVAIAIATPEHRRRLKRAVGRSALSRYVALDAAVTLRTFMRDGHPDPELFTCNVGDLVSSACASGRSVHAFGEMVSLLWEEGNVQGALELETLWNELGERESFSLYCAYHVLCVGLTDDLAAIKLVCDHHSLVIPMSAPSADAQCLGRRGAATFRSLAERVIRCARVRTRRCDKVTTRRTF